MICLTFDIEERFHSHLTPADTPRQWQLHDCISRVIDYLQEQGKRATFFVVAELALKYPDLIRRMSQLGFEVGSHSYTHLRLTKCNQQAYKEEISRSKKVLEDLTGGPIYGYRAPSWSVSISDSWLWGYLVSLGFRYDASLFPFQTYLYGSFGNPVRPFKIHPQLIEIPPTVYKLGFLRIPYGGGFYFRLYPFWLTDYLIKMDLNKKKTPVIYLHPWDFEPSSEWLEKKYLNRFIGNYNVQNTWAKFATLIKRYNTITLRQLYQGLGDVAEYPGSDCSSQKKR